MSRARLTSTAVMVSAALALTLTGCGSSAPKQDLSKLSATKLLSKASASVGDRDVTVTGAGKDGASSIAIKVAYVGNDSSGTITLGPSTVRLLKVKNGAWFKASDDYWTGQFGAKKGASILSLIHGRWISVDATSAQFKDLFSIANRAGLTTDMLKPTGSVTKGTPKTVDGTPSLTLKDGAGILYLDKSTARPVEITDSTSGASTLKFSYQHADAPKAPSASDVIDYSALAAEVTPKKAPAKKAPATKAPKSSKK